jgi:uncharacterized membrane protein
MTHFSITIEINAPSDRVWSVMRDIERWSEWTPSITSIERLDTGPFGVGSRALIRQPKSLPAKWEVTEMDEGKAFTWVTRRPGVMATARHSIEPAPGGSKASLLLEFSGFLGPLVARLTRNLCERYLALEAKGLKERSERSEAPPPAAQPLGHS